MSHHQFFTSSILYYQTMTTPIEETFSTFYEKWVTQLETDLQLLYHFSREVGPNGTDHEALVSRLTAHHKAYYTAKWAAAHEDILAFFNPVWLSPFENAYHWVTGWKPSTVFRLVSRTGISEEQAKKVEELRVRMRFDEEKVEREMERQQVAIADRWMLELARLTSRAQSGDAAALARVNGMVDAPTKSLLAGLEKVMKMADCVRLKSLKGILEVLDPVQGVNFLAATSVLHIQLRRFGKKREEKVIETVVETYHETTENNVGLGSLVIV